MQIDLTEEQFRRLLMLVYLGEWMAGSADMTDEQLKGLQDVADILYSLAPKNGVTDWVEYCENCGVEHANPAMEEALMPIIEDYEEEMFWDVLAHHLAYRDVKVQDDEEDAQEGGAQAMSHKMEMRLWHRKSQYDQEFQRHGLDHVRLVFRGGRK